LDRYLPDLLSADTKEITGRCFVHRPAFQEKAELNPGENRFQNVKKDWRSSASEWISDLDGFIGLGTGIDNRGYRKFPVEEQSATPFDRSSRISF
jgi:hypothetical protein